MEGNKKIENKEVQQNSNESEINSLANSKLEENKDLKILELEKKLETSNKLLHLVVHDFKSPFNSLIGFLDFYAEEIQDPEIKETMNMLSRESKKTFKLLESLSEFAYLRNMGEKMELLKLNLLEQVKSSVDPLLETAKQKQITFNTNSINENIEVLANPKMLQTVVRNLSSNAIKFTNIGGNIIIVGQKVNNNIEISVTDDGIGLSEKEMDKLFEKIGETKHGTNKETGTGFGLHFCKELVDEMGGTIRVESAEGHGAKFTVSLPAIESK